MGASGTGKSAILIRYMLNYFQDKPTQTFEDEFEKFDKLEGCSYQLKILDTSGNP